MTEEKTTEKPEEESEKNRENTEFKRDERGLFIKGTPPGPGRTKGIRDWKTIFEEAVKKIAEEKQIDPDSIEVDLVIKAIAGARGGDYRYHKDIFDRTYGQPKQSTDITTGGEKLPTPILNVFSHNSHEENKEAQQEDSGDSRGNRSEQDDQHTLDSN